MSPLPKILPLYHYTNIITTINLLETLQVSNRFISDSLPKGRESTITQTNYEMYATINQPEVGLSQFSTLLKTSVHIKSPQQISLKSKFGLSQLCSIFDRT